MNSFPSPLKDMTSYVDGPKDILWVNFGYQVPIDGASDHYKIITQNRKDGVRSRLIIRPVTDSDFGDYNCTVLNSHGVDSYVITLKEERKYCRECRVSSVGWKKVRGQNVKSF